MCSVGVIPKKLSLQELNQLIGIKLLLTRDFLENFGS